MEALLEREGRVEGWNDERLDELGRRIDAGFAQMDGKFQQVPSREESNQRFDAVERRIDRVNLRLEHMVWAMITVGGGLLGNLLAGYF
jgi:hypothetical protein